MKLALLELWRRPRRFMIALGSLSFLTLLLLFLGGLLDGLFLNSTGALRAQPDDAVVVLNADARDSIIRSRLSDENRAALESIDGVGDVEGLGLTLLGVEIDASSDVLDGAVVGYSLARDGLADPPPSGTAWVDRRFEAEGLKIGDEMKVGPVRTSVTVHGWIDDANFLGQGGLWVDLDTWRTVASANRPDLGLSDSALNAWVVTPADGVSAAELAASIESGDDGDVGPEGGDGPALSASIRDDAVEQLPGVKEQRSTFNAIIGTTFVVVAVVVGLFFALLTLERIRLDATLRALGSTSGRLIGGLVVQAVVVSVVSFAVGYGLSSALSAFTPPGVPVEFTTSRALFTLVGVTGTAVVGSLMSARRISRIDPAIAIGAGL